MARALSERARFFSPSLHRHARLTTLQVTKIVVNQSYLGTNGVIWTPAAVGRILIHNNEGVKNKYDGSKFDTGTLTNTWCFCCCLFSR